MFVGYMAVSMNRVLSIISYNIYIYFFTNCGYILKTEIFVHTKFAKDGFLLKLPLSSRNCSDDFLCSFHYGAPYEENKLDERVRRV